MKKLFFLLVTSLLFIEISQAQMVSSITQHGITWTFDQPYQTGQYANGDYWVLGPVTIISISPDFSAGRNGWEVNPKTYNSQGFDDRLPGYDQNLIPALPYTSSGTLESIVKTISRGTTTDRPKLQTAGVLTVVNAIPINNGANLFRPAYFGTLWKPNISTNSIATNLLPSYSAVANAPALSAIAANFARVQLDHRTDWRGREFHPIDNMPAYGANVNNHTASGALRLMLDDPISAKMPALINYLQAGIDFYSIAVNGGAWPSNGGHGNARKLPITFAALMLQDPAMQNNVSNWAQSRSKFQEDQDYYFSQQANNGTGQVLYGQPTTSEFNYWSSIIKLTGSKTAIDPYGFIDGGRGPGGSYQFCCTSMPNKGVATALLMFPELQCVWNNDQFISYVDRWVNIGAWAQNDPCAPADLSDTNMANYGVTYGPDGNGGCILDTDPSDGIGRYPNNHAINADGGNYQNPFANSLWTAYRASTQVNPCGQVCVVNAGTGSTLIYCDTSQLGIGSIDLFDHLTGGPDLNGIWSDLDGSSQLTGSTLNVELLPLGTFTFQYVVTNPLCAVTNDTSEIVITINQCIPPQPCSTSFTPIIDGQQDSGWGAIPSQNITNNIIGIVGSSSDLSGSFKLHWDTDNLYLFVEVQDDLLINDNSIRHFNDDGVSVYLDGGNENTTTYDTNDHNMQFRWNDPVVKDNGSLNPAGVLKGEFQTATGYSMEMSIPWSTIGYLPTTGHTIGIDIHLNDDDDGNDRDKKLTWTDLQDLAWTNPSVLGDYVLNDPCNTRLVTCDLAVLMEGPFDPLLGMMGNSLLQSSILPMGQPYSAAPWNYPGTEGTNWLPSDYPAGSVDWVLVSFRESLLGSSKVAEVAAVVLQDGSIPSFDLSLAASYDALYIVIEHRNHLPVISSQPVDIINNTITYDFTSTNGYVAGAGFSQKQIGQNWVLYAGNGVQDNPGGFDIIGSDKILWQTINGTFDFYHPADYNLDGDINGSDKIIWDENNGISSSVLK